jgi:hypothetical protein
MKKPETAIERTQVPATGSVNPRNDTDVEKEAAAMGISTTPISRPNDNQGGN